jgi:hypothetical protein
MDFMHSKQRVYRLCRRSALPMAIGERIGIFEKEARQRAYLGRLLSVFSSESGTRSEFYRRSCGTAGLCVSGSSPNKLFRNKHGRLSSGPSPKASLGLGSLTRSRRFAQRAPTRRETIQNGVTSMNTNIIQHRLPVNTILNGNCIDKMRQMPSNSIDFILPDPPYLVNYRDRNGRSIPNDANTDWLRPAMRGAYRILKQDRVAIMFYG